MNDFAFGMILHFDQLLRAYIPVIPCSTFSYSSLKLMSKYHYHEGLVEISQALSMSYFKRTNLKDNVVEASRLLNKETCLSKKFLSKAFS